MKIALGIGVLLLLGVTLGVIMLRGSTAPSLPGLPLEDENTVPVPRASDTAPVAPGESFRGPTGPPHIVGPKSDPPNY